MKIGILVGTMGLALLNGYAMADDPGVLEKNKRLVSEFYDLAFNRHRPLEAAAKYLAPDYKQHNPSVADGRKGFVDAFGGEPKNAQSRIELKRLIAEGDLVVIHSLGRLNPKDRGVAVVDIFRVKGDTIMEHWDVMQPVPEKSANRNTMF